MIDTKNKTILECPSCRQMYLVDMDDISENNTVTCPECLESKELLTLKEIQEKEEKIKNQGNDN